MLLVSVSAETFCYFFVFSAGNTRNAKTLRMVVFRSLPHAVCYLSTVSFAGNGVRVELPAGVQFGHG